MKSASPTPRSGSPRGWGRRFCFATPAAASAAQQILRAADRGGIEAESPGRERRPRQGQAGAPNQFGIEQDVGGVAGDRSPVDEDGGAGGV